MSQTNTTNNQGAGATSRGASGPSVVSFQHKFFSSFEDPYFRRSQEAGGEAVMVLSLAGNEVALSLSGIKREFNIPDESADGIMLDTVADSLNFVQAMRPGDAVPTEILSGQPSWEIAQRHRDIAYQRLTMQLVTWLSGDETLLTDPEQLMQIAEDPQTKKRVNEAFEEAAEQLGFGRDQKNEVIQLIENLAEDLAGIEALRDLFGKVRIMEQKIQAYRKLYGAELSVLEVADPVARLMTIAAKEFQDHFELLDAQTGEIMAVLRNIEKQTAYIRKMRDDLHRRLMAWTEMLEIWENALVKKWDGAPDLLRNAYRFLAPRFMPVQEWVLNGQLYDSKKKKSSEMVW